MKNTTLCYLEQDGQYLMLHRVKKQNDENHDKWIGIGGKFEDRESPEDCALREVYEETGLTMRTWRYCGIVTFVSDLWPTEYMHLFHCDNFTGTLRECNEGVLEWIHKDQLMKLPLWAGDKLFLDLIHEPDTPFFSMKLRYEGERLAYAALNGKELAVE